MKLYKNLVNSVALTLQEIFIKNRYADKALEKVFKEHVQWGSRDRRFVAEAVYDIVRNYRLYAQLAESEKNFWFITAVWLVLKNNDIPDWQEFKHVDAAYILSQKDLLKSNPAVYESYPDWLWDLGTKELGAERWQKEAISMNQQAPVFLRTNTLKTTTVKLSEALKKENIETIEVQNLSNALQLKKRENVFQNKLFKEGWFEVQDAGSQMIAEFLAPGPSDYVIDACAGAGGKSLHMAALMNNKGKILALDVEAFKLEELRKRAKRAGAFNIETKTIETGKTIKSLEKRADKLLLDVPCSGLGVLKRNPDAKWKLSAEVIERTRLLQQTILTDYSSMLKINGTMVYSTCSILPSENKQQVSLFLEQHPNFALLAEKNLFPSDGFDGFYMALLKRNS
ncbi:MAG TPA: RsmB/NOP family class I SAM-dependent RNA methyltransferase [Bacteroidia bacterium]|nr:RsmB/NOP family class I SAM-dependent RNA methyltransferase [Bacteroidia bacterium]